MSRKLFFIGNSMDTEIYVQSMFLQKVQVLSAAIFNQLFTGVGVVFKLQRECPLQQDTLTFKTKLELCHQSLQKTVSHCCWRMRLFAPHSRGPSICKSVQI